MVNADSIIKSVTSVTKKWTKQRKAEERRASARANRSRMWSAPRVTLVDAAEEVMEEAYLKASSGGTLPASARQIMYAARRQILELTERVSLNSQYFSQVLLPEYMARHPDTTADWDVTYDARGHFAEPHTEVIVPIGTLDVRAYLGEVDDHVVEDVVNSGDFHCSSRFPSCGPKNRFSAIMFIEKEGFMPLFEVAKLAERYDIAIMSTKGMPVVACRHLADRLCGEHNVPLLVLHDFDKAGFSILGTLQDVDHWGSDSYDRTKRYEFDHDIQVIDLGLRLEDVKAYDLESEDVCYRSDPSGNLAQNGAAAEEIEFLCRTDSWHGQRVELNAFTSADFIEWIESKLDKQGIKKIVPNSNTLRAAYRRAAQIAMVHEQLPKIVEEAGRQVEKVKIPKTLERMIRRRMKENPEVPWDQVVAKVAARHIEETD